MISHEQRLCWAANVALACAIAVALVMAAAIVVRTIEVTQAWRDRQIIGWMSEQADTARRPVPRGCYPDPCCEFCGRVMDAPHDCPGHE